MTKMLLWASLLAASWCEAQERSPTQSRKPTDSLPPRIFTLGTVEVISKKQSDLNGFLSRNRLQTFAKNDVSKALNLLPGVHLSAVGPRNEAMVYVRGFDLRQVPLLIDGIPVYIPYDGYVDLARFTTFDLSAIHVSKGYTSVLYGPNALGGAINLVSSRPEKKLEINGASGWLSGGYRMNINVGSNLGKFYVQAGASKLNRDSFPLSNNFIGTKTENGDGRNNSYNSDEKYSVKVGFTPNKRSEYALSYIYQHGKKGSPVYTGKDTLNSQFKSPRYWQWPYWDKQSLYFIANTAIDSVQYIKARLYYDKFKNQLNSYDDATYTSISRPYAFKSHYNDYTFGGIAEYGRGFWQQRDQLKLTVQFKQDVHREHNEGEPERTMSDNTFTAGLENEFKITDQLLLLTGLSYNNRNSLKAQDYNSTTKTISDYPSNDNDAFNIQGGLEYRLNNNSTFTASAARKTRFATTKDRYSYRLGTAIPNPYLAAEYALNYELGYRGYFNNRLSLQAALFYSKIHNTIQSVSNVKYDSVRKVWQSQLQNVGESEFMGVEAGFEYLLIASLKLGTNYTYVKRNNLSNPAIRFTDVPEHKVFGFAQYQLQHWFSLQANIEYNADRYSTTYGTKAGSFTLLNARALVPVWKYFSVEGGINNIGDVNYSLVEGYPEPGRNYFVNVVYRL
ncbi:TonB-dependent receptor [Paraflavitalea sp. CAU 1676]|uniref:TonB-dependent receptor plug domain-containing protein n=1 Tax=Paraflavitalea sp. CAU 1676 TaxID=3032598 RepID=UPI0023DB95AE|nr:TonB-dependent receptor [Paraflavitalea sp. CAU 1676]MDF2189871.1 TonB-dependent receptor [Paraflavitalea sp. CAU 1676]